MSFADKVIELNKVKDELSRIKVQMARTMMRIKKYKTEDVNYSSSRLTNEKYRYLDVNLNCPSGTERSRNEKYEYLTRAEKSMNDNELRVIKFKIRIDELTTRLSSYPEGHILGEIGISIISPDVSVTINNIIHNGSNNVPNEERVIPLSRNSIYSMLHSLSIPQYGNTYNYRTNNYTPEYANNAELVTFYKKHNEDVFNAIIELDTSKTKLILDLVERLAEQEKPLKKELEQMKTAERVSDYDVIVRNGLAQQYLQNDRQNDDVLLDELGVEIYYADCEMSFDEFAKYVINDHGTLDNINALIALADNADDKMCLYGMKPELFGVTISLIV